MKKFIIKDKKGNKISNGVTTLTFAKLRNHLLATGDMKATDVITWDNARAVFMSKNPATLGL